MTLRQLLQQHASDTFAHPILGRVDSHALTQHYNAYLKAQVFVEGACIWFRPSPLRPQEPALVLLTMDGEPVGSELLPTWAQRFVSEEVAG